MLPPLFVRSALLAAAGLALAVPRSFADEWALPQHQRFCSVNRVYCLDIDPRRLTNQLEFFGDKVEGKPNAGGAPGLAENWPKATLSRRQQPSHYQELSRFRLVNDVSPQSAIISDSGRYIVTFDNWFAIGFGEDVVVIYRQDGSLVRKLGLSDFLTEDFIRGLGQSTSMIAWSGSHHIDEIRGLLVLQVPAPCGRGPIDNPTYVNVEIDLATGFVLTPIVDSPIRWKVDLVEPPPETPQAPAPPIDGNPTTSSIASQGALVEIPYPDLLSHAVRAQLPEYPRLARLARVRGIVTFRLNLSVAGEVESVEAVRGLPMGVTQACLEALKGWSFSPIRKDGKPARATGTLAFDFREVDTCPPVVPTKLAGQPSIVGRLPGNLPVPGECPPDLSGSVGAWAVDSADRCSADIVLDGSEFHVEVDCWDGRVLLVEALSPEFATPENVSLNDSLAWVINAGAVLLQSQRCTLPVCEGNGCRTSDQPECTLGLPSGWKADVRFWRDPSIDHAWVTRLFRDLPSGQE
jgi:TonB family protein